MKKRNFQTVFMLLLILLCGTNIACGNQKTSQDTPEEKTDEYGQLLIQIMEYSGSMDKFNDYQLAFIPMAQEKIQESDKSEFKKMSEEEKEQAAREMTQKYFKGAFKKDLADLLSPYFRKEVSLEQLKDYAARLKDEKVRIAMQHVLTASSSSVIEESISQGMEVILTGEKPETVSPKACTDTYRKWFEEYYTISDAPATIDNVLSQLNNMIPQNGDSPEIPNADLIEKMIDYVKENMKTCMLNAYTDHVSEDDLRTLCEMQKQPSAQAALKASQNMAHNIMSVGMEIIAKYNTWLDSQL